MHKLFITKAEKKTWRSSVNTLAVKEQYEVKELFHEQVQGIKAYFESPSHIVDKMTTRDGTCYMKRRKNMHVFA